MEILPSARSFRTSLYFGKKRIFTLLYYTSLNSTVLQERGLVKVIWNLSNFMGLNCLVIFFDCNEAKMFEVGLFAKSLTTYSRFAIIFVQFVRIFSNSLKITSRIRFIPTLCIWIHFNSLFIGQLTKKGKCRSSYFEDVYYYRIYIMQNLWRGKNPCINDVYKQNDELTSNL